MARPSIGIAFALGSLVAGCSTQAPADGGLDAVSEDTVTRDLTFPASYTETVFDSVRIGSNSGAPDFQHADATVQIHDGPFASVTLVVDLASTCYPFTNWQSDPPPPGQRWPADCDAFDRNFEFTLDEPATQTDPPAIELMRAITPFGGPEHFEIDITDVANARPGAHTLRVTIPTYSDPSGQVTGSNGGWTVSAHVTAVPGPAPRNVLAVIPLFNLVQDATTMPADIGFDVPAGTATTRFEYRATGHGGANAPGDPECFGPAEEFCDRTHTLFVDDAMVDTFDLFRNDCDQNCTLAMQAFADGGGFEYCMQNPCGAIGSVRASRANWCPGTLTPPRTSDFDALHTAGHHTLRYAIDHVAMGGSWRMSGVLFAFGP